LSEDILRQAVEKAVLTSLPNEVLMRYRRLREQGRAGWIMLWLLGVPLPILLILFLLRGCT
jgi:hypothetical protein